MKHAQFIEKITAAEPVAVAYFACQSFKATAKQCGITPLVAATKVRFYDAHSKEPQCPWLGDFTHEAVLRASTLVPLADKTQMRQALIDKFRVSTDGPVNVYPDHVPADLMRKLMTSVGLKWFDLDGKPVVHWNER